MPWPRPPPSSSARAGGIAFGAGRTLDRYGRMAQVFADSPQLFRSADLGRAEPAIRDIAVYDADGTLLAHLDALDARARPAPLRPARAGPCRAQLAFRDGTAHAVVVVYRSRPAWPLAGNSSIVARRGDRACRHDRAPCRAGRCGW